MAIHLIRPSLAWRRAREASRSPAFPHGVLHCSIEALIGQLNEAHIKNAHRVCNIASPGYM